MMMKFNKIPFTIEIPTQPYVEDFSQGLTHPAVYTGNRFCRFQIDNQTGEIKELCAGAETLEELDNKIIHPDEGHSLHTIDARQFPWEAAYLTNHFELEPRPWYTEDLGTVDADGNPETWSYDWGRIIHQVYYMTGLKYVNGQYIKPRFRAHQHNNQHFWRTIDGHIENCERELAREGVYSDEQIQQIRDYKSTLESLPAKYGDTLHWKIKFPNVFRFKP
jgi:hypothetical protein